MTNWNTYKTELARFSPLELLRGGAAAQLHPRNAGRLLRLSAFTQAALSLPSSEDGRVPSREEFLGLIQTAGAVSGFSLMEDPSDNAPTEHLVVPAGDFVVFPGIEEEAVHSLELLLTGALELLRRGGGTPELHRAVRSCLALLTLSDEVYRRGAEHLTAGAHEHGVYLPDDEGFQRLKDAVTYTELDLTGVLTDRGLDVGDLAPFIVAQGSGPVGEPGLDGGLLAHQPLVASGDAYVFFPVGQVLRAARHLLLTPNTFTAALEAVYYDLAWRGVQVSLRRMGIVQPLVAFAGVHTPLVRTRAFEIDGDKVLHLALVGDPFRNYRPHELFEPSDLSALQPQLDGSYAALQALLSAFPEGSRSQVFSLVVFEGIGNVALLPALGAETAYALSVGASDLEMMSYDFERDPLGLLYFAQAVGDLYRRHRLGLVGTLDLFDAYRRHGHSFYLSDHAPPTGLFLMPGGAGNVRRERRAELAAHGVPYGPVWTRVTNYHRDPGVALFQSLEMLRGGLINLLAEGDALRIWVVAQHEEALDVNLPLIAETLAFWLWQLAPHLEEDLAEAGPHLLRVVILPVSTLPPDPEAPLAGLRVLPDPRGRSVLLQVDETFTANFTTPDNLPERTLMRRVLGALGEVMVAHGLLSASPDLEAAIARVMGDPAKKKISVLRDVPVLLGGDELPRARVLQEHQESRSLDFLANALGADFPVGTLREGADAPALLNAAVGKLYGEFVRLAGTLDAGRALPYFVRQHEATVQQTASRQFTFDFTRRCYAGHPITQQRLREEYGRNNRTAIASRFVIEYLAAQPPQGEDAPTLELYDRLIALAALIHAFGTNSDLAFHRLAHVTAEILPSGRLASDRGAYEPARTAFEANMFDDVTRESLSLARSYLGDLAPGDELPDRALLDAAFERETGWTLGDTLAFLDTVSALPGSGVLPRQMPLPDFLRTLARALGWDEGKVRALLDTLSLTPRPHFLRPPRPWRPEDVQPWRFNRRLSSLRRPVLLLEGEATPQVVWGPRAAASASHYLLDLLHSGRFKADSVELRQLLGEVNRSRGRAFNQQVAAFLRALGFWHVQEQAKVFGRVRLRDEHGLDLGDIDVFVVDDVRRRVYCVECKNFAVARTAAETHALFERLERGTATERSIVERHERRVHHVRQHLPAILEHFGLPPGDWEVEGFIVFNHDSVAYSLSSAALPVLSFEQFVRRMEHGVVRGAALPGTGGTP
ncbi:hypothetical protein DAERI_020029 [Deinococcus aerius]|uniref:NERD domain-containing protein n=2 Tax=Deinococcus TaxID=1298 RepID=A0A2I9CS46_9DEIO|nr:MULTISPECIES: hypothetical protein [Deinococcus]MBB5293690.1 hypothetical protein [Deinococcus metallilatus]QBY07339.1 hypothetical protein E5F05_05010 [Deinococcus metallilatus]RXJ14812.1 hypothetical protein ERJ73_03730 [Deinococcus metallilatus]TLK30933.1 hypothetical protein FCS05_04045 [Deinococcus metallilatus]GBF04432.1 hypothetical protein DAERI_020029 [Deinococcus aerius]